jgi:Bromodomain
MNATNMSSAASSITQEEYVVAEMVLQILIHSEKYKNKNLLFIEPFDINEVPDYLERVGPPMDLRTIANRFDAHPQFGNFPSSSFASYSSIDDFWSDIHKVYQNAIAYHSTLPNSKWIAKFAKDMIKIVNREKKNAEMKVLHRSDPSSIGLYEPPTSIPSNSSLSDAFDPVASPESVVPVKSSKLKLKLPMAKAASQFSMNQSTHSLNSVTSPTKRLKLKLSTGTANASPSTNMSDTTSVEEVSSNDLKKKNKTVPKKAKSTQLKLKLTLTKSAHGGKGIVKSEDSANDLSNDAIEEGELMTVKTKASVIMASNPSRGKELPQGVVAPAAQLPKTKKIKKSSTSISSSGSNVGNKLSSSSSVSAASPSTAPTGLDAAQTRQCCKVINGLKRRKSKQIYWFLAPVSDKNILLDYKSKIKAPMDIQTIQTKLDKNSYKKLDHFVLDLRRVFSNALRYNTSIKDSLRPLAVEGLQCAESLMLMFLARNFTGAAAGGAQYCYAPLLYCWNVCINIMDTLYNLVNPSDGQPMAYYFLHPVSVYCGGKFPPDYLDVVKKPMDFGTITANLVEGRYQTIESFSSDCRLVIQNCQTYYQGREEGRLFVDQALRINECLATQLSQLARYDKSMKGESERRKAMQLFNPTRITQEMILPNQPPVALFLGVIEDMRALKYTDKGTKITEPAMTPFERPVSLHDFPDYLQYVSEPIDLQTIEKKVKSNDYETPEDFECDMNTMMKNCEVYNLHRDAQHPVSMAKFAIRKFRAIFYAKIQAYEDPSSVVQAQPHGTSADGAANDETERSEMPPPKKIKIDVNASKGKSIPRISISASQVASATSAARAKSPSTTPISASSLLPSQRPAPPKPKADAPVPLHIAIAKVKEAFPLRRAVKSLQSWEADCARYHKELMRHPWISASRPKFVFSCPVPILFPELSEHYAAKIRRPMDLTTIECTLLAGNRYAGPEDFIQDVALVFANAIRFNKDGKDIGDPLSCAYYDASVHLLKYSRWLSLELLSNYVEESDHKDEPGSDGLPPFSWKLTAGNRELAREEVENIVLIEPIEKSLEGDRYTWMELECEKLLKALRHQSDLKYMTFFIQPNYPADYTAFISKPMDWERVQRTLKKRHYETIGHLISDLRLIFSNAEKYNARLKGTDTVSGRAYEAAKYMSDKLEAAINKLLLTVSDRLERERIDHVNAEREIEAAELAEEAEIRAAWKKQEDLPTNALDGSAPTASAASSAADTLARRDMFQKTRIFRRLPQRRYTTDFEIPFFDEDSDGIRPNDRSLGDSEVVKVQKTMFEKQRYEFIKMRKVCTSIGASVFHRLLQRQIKDQEEFEQFERSNAVKLDSSADVPMKDALEAEVEEKNGAASSVLEALEREGRSRLQIQLKPSLDKKKAKKKSTVNSFASLEGDE